MPSPWHRLYLSHGGPPLLLFQYIWTHQGYEIYLTDLTYVWAERLFYKDIAKRAEEEATTIDPGEDPEQLKVLLEKIEQALQRGKESTVLSSGTQTDSLEITTTSKLPAPLKPLVWPLKLSKEPLSSATSRLLIPLLKEEVDRESRQRSLLGQIKQKDYVLSKLFDKLESLGAELGSVFPSAAGLRTSRKGSTRSEAGRFVRGIAPFDEEAWLADLGSSTGTGFGSNLFQEMSESGSVEELENIKEQGEWWRQLQHRSQKHTRETTPDQEEAVASSLNKQNTAVESQYHEEGESTANSDLDEFERQETPPHLKLPNAKESISSPIPKSKRKSPTPRAPSETDEATASDTDSEPEPAPKSALQKNRIPSSSPEPEPVAPASSPPKAREAPQKKPRGGLGVIGGKKKKEPEPAPEPEPDSTPSPTYPKEELKSRDEENNGHPGSISPAPVKPKRTGKLGMIGGKARAKAKQLSQDETPSSTSQTVVASPEKTLPNKPNPAQDGNTPEPADQQTIKREESPLPKPAVGKASTAPPAEPETEDQRASRKREELKRQLEAKSKAPAKKKRRF
ncbi:uncharacterized protein N7511_010248 [Penicillium nucicola]|uniref:uncharacterized protein n=1 Tax=Penicillium nucicola TaxID=1850975 RepID=UPI002545A50D|nr:uncharacterized protein N7511_010248 [Penicillium nucicola]KAJ5748552.1 hypothetical protein N7511_010248 [Penicillium nucicola]